MDSASFIWVVLLLSAVAAGASFVGVLVVRQHAEFVLAVAGIGCFALATYSMFSIASIFERADAVMYALAFLAAGIAGGWSLASSLLDRLSRRDGGLEAPERLPADNGGTAVIVLSCTEPRVYDPSATAGTLRELAEEGLIEPSITTLPFLFFAQKTRYRAIGGTSPAHGELVSLTERVEHALGQTAVTRVDFAACSGGNDLSTRVLGAALAGYRHVVVVQLTVAESLHLAAAKRATDTLRLETLGMHTAYTDALSTAERIIRMLGNRVLSTVAERDVTGVVLVGHGQPEERAKRHPRFDEEETAFLSRIRMRLIDAGIPERNVRVAWAEWRSPDVTSAVRHLAALGCKRVVVLPGVFTLDTIGTRLDLEVAVRQARVDENVSVVTLPAWHDDEEVVGEIVERVREELADQAT